MAQQARSLLLAVLLFSFSIQTVRASNSLAPVTIYSSKLQRNTVNYQPLDSRHLISSLYRYIKNTAQLSSQNEAQQYAFLQPLVSSSSSLVVVVGQFGQHHPPPSSSTTTHMQLPNAVQSVLLGNDNIKGNDDDMVKALACDPSSPYYRSTTEATSGNDLVVICPDTEEQEAAVVTALIESLNNDNDKPMVLVHIPSSPSRSIGQSASQLQQQRRRALLSTQQQQYDNTTGCDATCQRQVRYMEAFIVFVTLFLALSVGVTCMQLVDTPTRFLTAQGGSGHGRLHQD